MQLNIQAMNYLPTKYTLSFARSLALMLLLVAPFGFAQDSSSEPDTSALVGSWGGPLVIGEDDLGLIFNFSRDGEGYSATMISDGLGIYGMPADRVRVNGLSLTVNIRRLDVEFMGTLRFDESGENLLRIDANWLQGSEMVPVVLRPIE